MDDSPRVVNGNNEILQRRNTCIVAPLGARATRNTSLGMLRQLTSEARNAVLMRYHSHESPSLTLRLFAGSAWDSVAAFLFLVMMMPQQCEFVLAIPVVDARHVERVLFFALSIGWIVH